MPGCNVTGEVRRILVDHARRRRSEKRGGDARRFTLQEFDGGVNDHALDDRLLDLEQALQQLETVDPRAARVVELRYFGGLREIEAAEVLGISVATLKRDWDFAKAWLASKLRD